MTDDEKTDGEIEEFSTELKDRIASLESMNDRLMDEAKQSEGEKRYIKSEMVRLQKEIQRLRFELDRMKKIGRAHV